MKVNGKFFLDKILNNKKSVYNFVDSMEMYNAFNRHLYIAEIDSCVGDDVSDYIRFYNLLDEEEEIPIEERDPIHIYINSPGGDVSATLTIIDAIRNSKTPVYTINTGEAYSGGFFIFIAGHKRFAYPHSTFLYHEGYTGSLGDANKFNNFADFYKKVLGKLKDITIEYTNISSELYEEHRKDDWWLFADEALELGICDVITNEII